MTTQEYQTKLSSYQKAISIRRSLEMTVRMNNVWLLNRDSKRGQKRLAKIEQAKQQLAALVVPPKPEPVIEGFQIFFDDEGTFGGFVRTQDIEEAKEQARQYHETFTVKAKYTT